MMGTCSCGRSRPAGFGLGLILGLVGGVLGATVIARKRSSRREPQGMRAWRRELVKTRGSVGAGFLCARVQQRYDALYASRPRFDQPALRDHLEKNILPGLALYQALCEGAAGEAVDREAVFAELDRLLEASMLESQMVLQAKLLRLFPDPFAFFRAFITRSLPRQYPQSEWGFRWVENSPNAVAFDATDCFYLRVLTAYGAPELTSHFCHLDDFLMSRFPYIAWKRTGTLGRGDAVCDFRYERIKM